MLRLTSLRLPTALVATAILAVAVPLITYGTLRGPLTGNSPATDAGATAKPTSARLEVELVTLRADGCEPSEIVRPKGPFILLVDDRSGAENSSLSLTRQGERLRAVSVNRKKSEWHDIMNLPPGDYLLTDTENPQRACQITILP